MIRDTDTQFALARLSEIQYRLKLGSKTRFYLKSRILETEGYLVPVADKHMSAHMEDIGVPPYFNKLFKLSKGEL